MVRHTWHLFILFDFLSCCIFTWDMHLIFKARLCHSTNFTFLELGEFLKLVKRFSNVFSLSVGYLITLCNNKNFFCSMDKNICLHIFQYCWIQKWHQNFSATSGFRVAVFVSWQCICMGHSVSYQQVTKTRLSQKFLRLPELQFNIWLHRIQNFTILSYLDPEIWNF